MPLSPVSSSGGGSSRQDQAVTGLGYIAWSSDPVSNVNAVAPGAGTLAATAIGLNAGDTITNIVSVITVAGSGTAPTLIKVGLFNSAFALVASSADSHGSAIWTATGIAIAPLSATYSVPTSGVYYAAFLKVGTFSVTQPSFLYGSTQTFGGRSATGISRRWFEQTGLSDLPNPAVPANPVNASIWLAVS